MLDTLLDEAPDVSRSSDVPIIESRFDAPGKRFSPSHEVALYPVVASVAGSVRGAANRGLLIREFVGPFGIADFALILLDEDQLEERLSSEVPPLLREIDSAVVSALSFRYARSIEEVAVRIGRVPESVERRVRYLQRVGAVTTTDDGRLRSARELVTLGNIHTFEAKVRDWGSAIKQARRYALWAEYSTVVLGPDVVIDTARQRSKALGIGLAQGERWVHRPRRNRASGAVRMWASEHIVAAILGTAT